MQDEFHRAAVLACRILLKPIVRFLLRYGLAYKEFSEIAKYVFIEVAGSSSEGRNNYSHISVKTGISRKEIRRVIGSKTDPLVNNMMGVLPIRVMSLWFSKVRFTDNAGQPLVLPLADDNKPSLSELIGHVSVDVPETAVVKELIKSGAVVERDGFYEAKSRQFLYSPLRAESIIKGGFDIAALADTVVENLSQDGERRNLKFQRKVYSLKISEKNSIVFQKYLTKKAENFLEKMDTKLTGLEDSNKVEEEFFTGLGVYYFRKELVPEINKDIIDHLHV